MTAELQLKQYHVFFENLTHPEFGCHRDDAGVVTIKLHRLRLSIYGRTFNRLWK